MGMKVQTNYSYNGTTITSWNTQVFPSSGGGWAYTGLVASNDWFSTGSGNPKGHHSSYRQGLWDLPVIGDKKNLWVQTTVYAPAGYACSSGGGV